MAVGPPKLNFQEASFFSLKLWFLFIHLLGDSSIDLPIVFSYCIFLTPLVRVCVAVLNTCVGRWAEIMGLHVLREATMPVTNLGHPGNQMASQIPIHLSRCPGSLSHLWVGRG